MEAALYWLSDREWMKIEPLMPRARRCAQAVWPTTQTLCGPCSQASTSGRLSPPIRRRKLLIPYDARTYRQRNLIERMFGRLNDFRRVATHYDKLARNILATALLAAIVIWWLN